MNKLAVTVYTAFMVIGATTYVAEARPVYARQENKPCGYCHVRGNGGGERGFRGQFYGANGLSFNSFSEKREAIIAGLSPDGDGVNTIPVISYNGNVTGPAAQQIQLASLRGPVLLLFLDKVDEASKTAVKSFAALAKGYGTKATLLGVAKADAATALKLSEELGGLIRVYPDPEGTSIKKFSGAQALDVAVVAKLGDPLKTFAGYSRANLDEAMKLLKATQNVDVPTVELSLFPEKAVRGAKL